MRMRILGLALAIAGAGWGAEDYGRWTRHRDLLVDASPAGADLKGNLAGYPLAVALGPDPAGLFAQARSGGADLRFSAEDGSHLAYQIESWDAAAQKAAVWVRLPSVEAGRTLRLRVHWGNPAATDSSNGPAVFATADGFRGVWHMASAADASPNAITAQDSGTAADPAGRIGPARRFANPESYAKAGAYMNLGNPAALNLKGIITMEAWAKWERRDGHRIIVCHGAAPGSAFETVLRIGEYKDYRTGVWTGESHHAALEAPAADSNTWVHLGGVYTGTGWILYRNGERLAATAADTNGAKPSPGNWRIGAEYAGGITRYYCGSLDEVRIEAAARSEDWFKLTYATQREGQTAVRWAEAQSGLSREPGMGKRAIRDMPIFQLYLDEDGEGFDATGRLVPIP